MMMMKMKMMMMMMMMVTNNAEEFIASVFKAEKKAKQRMSKEYACWLLVWLTLQFWIL
jgi:hypothetical protein